MAAKKPRILDCINKSVISGLWEVIVFLYSDQATSGVLCSITGQHFKDHGKLEYDQRGSQDGEKSESHCHFEEEAAESRLGDRDDIIAVYRYLNWLDVSKSTETLGILAFFFFFLMNVRRY